MYNMNEKDDGNKLSSFQLYYIREKVSGIA